MKQFMKRLLFIFGGAILIGVAVYFLIGIFAAWYGPRFVKSDDDIGIAYMYFLLVLLIGAISGGVAGNVLFRNLIRRSSRRA